ncbi:hypothetical protein ACH4SP_05285 [Streptomyces sp. NPDC021093]
MAFDTVVSRVTAAGFTWYQGPSVPEPAVSFWNRASIGRQVPERERRPRR